MKKILGVYSAPQPHWVGDGFPVRSLFSYESHGKQLSPFLLLDYAGPARFPQRPSLAVWVSIPIAALKPSRLSTRGKWRTGIPPVRVA